ncbi:L,D-transpeptidase family protein [Paenibacillus oryzisoli]|uniref:L,D-transpeptidase family protein n=1 Tax=Paenibacillus oryzisoli TaxID=1850517 RepID=UPI003D2AB7BB
MIRRKERFRNQLDDHLIHLHKNLYISQSDPLYYEKVIRYLDASSPEAHYNLGQKFQLKGNWKRAFFHYKEVLKTYPSPFYSAANRALHQMNQQQAAHTANLSAVGAVRKPLLPPFMKKLLIVLAVINMLLLLVLALGGGAMHSSVSKMKAWGVGREVTYETVDAPFVLYVSEMTSQADLEKALHKQAVQLAKDMPKTSILLYGVVTQDSTSLGKTMRLTNEDLIKQAIVVARYQPETDDAVQIRFLNAAWKEHQPLTAIGANLVRTALMAYRGDKGQAPESLDMLLQDYPSNYLSYIPKEASSGSNVVAKAYTGAGGWVYNPQAQTPEELFYANTAGAKAVPYAPIHIEINKAEHQLKLLAGNQLLWDKPIGLGQQDSTPVGDFIVTDRVLQPHGKTAASYGEAGLGLGAIALHGTYDDSSIGGNASLGCVRLSNADIAQLYPFVPKGTAVHIQAAGWPSLQAELASPPDALQPAALPKHDESPEHVVFHWLG